MYRIATRSSDIGADLLIVLIGSWKEVVSSYILRSGLTPTYFDLVHHIETILESLIRERNSDQRTYKPVGIGGGTCECIAEVRSRFSDRGVSAEHYETCDTDTVWAMRTQSDLACNPRGQLTRQEC